MRLDSNATLEFYAPTRNGIVQLITISFELPTVLTDFLSSGYVCFIRFHLYSSIAISLVSSGSPSAAAAAGRESARPFENYQKSAREEVAGTRILHFARFIQRHDVATGGDALRERRLSSPLWSPMSSTSPEMDRSTSWRAETFRAQEPTPPVVGRDELRVNCHPNSAGLHSTADR